MGRLSPIINYSMLVLTIIVITFLMPNHAAPVQDTAASRYANEKGCYFMNKHYQTGHVIETNDPCMNCTCTNAAMMCYLRVCPFIKPLGENCHMEKHVGDCCPKYWCPEVYPRVTAPRPDKDEKGCYLNGLYYEEGSRLPVDPLNPCHACYCIRNVSVCTNETCELHIPGCYPRYKIGSCCPASYECTEDAATTVPPTMLEAETPAPGCNVDGILYEDGVEVPSNESCNKCYCMRHQVMCTAIECTAPGTNCVPQEVLEGQCCPEKYDCPEDTQISEFSTTHMISTEEEFLNLTTIAPPFTSTATSFSVPVAEDLASKDAFSTTESEQLFPTTKGIRRIDEGETVTVVPGLDVEETTTAGTIMTVTGPRIPKITEIPEDMFTTSKPRIATGRPFFPKRPIPGEGICRHEDRTYQNREKVESSDPCRENCTCVNSVVKCDVIECVLEPPTPGVKCKVKKLDNECCPKYICDIPSITTLSEETEIPDKDTAEETFTKDFLENITLPDIVTMQAETVTEEKVVSETTESSTEVFRQTTLEAEIIAKSGATTTEKEQSVFTEELLSVSDAKSTEEPRSTQESTDEIKDTITETAITAKEKHTEAEIVPEKDGISTTSVILEAETVTITTPTEKPFKVTITEQDVTDKPLDAQMTTISAVIKDSTEIVPTTFAEEKETQFIPEKLSTTTGVTKITSETESSITQLSTKEKDVTEALTTDLSTIGKDDEEIFTKVSKETTLEIKTTETLESVTSEITTKEEIIAATATPMKEDVSTTDKKFQAETVSTSHPLVDFTTKEGLSTIETKTTEIPEMSSTVFFSDEKELNITDEKTTPTSTLELKITSAFLPTDEKEQTVVTEGEFLKVSEAKSTVEPSTAQVSTDKIKETSTITPITTKVKDMESQVTSEKEGTSTTVAILEAETVTISEKEKLTLAAEEIKTELEKEITDGMKRITTVLPTKDQDLETEVTPEKESIPKTAETTKIETITITSSAMEKEKSTHVTEEISELATKTTEEMKDITTVPPTKQKGTDSEIIAEISTTKATTEVESVTLIPRVTQKEIIIPTTEEIKTELETEVTHETKEVSTALPTKETESEASAEKDLISTTAITAEAETIAVTESVTERVETIPTTGEMKTELATKLTDEMKEITTPLITIEKGEETEVASEKERISTTTTMFEAETVTIIPRVPQREEITPTTDDIKTESETGTTEMKEISTVLPIKETELETKVTTEKESISTTSAVTATLTPSVMEKEKSTFTTEESKPELETETTHEMKEISIALPTTKKDVQPETAPEKQFISTTTAMLEAETVAITQKATEKEKLIPITEESKTKLTTKITDEMKDFTIILPIKEKDAETEAIAVEEGISTTATALETKTVTITTIVTETEKSTSISRESTTESEMAKTGEMTEITTALPTKEKDVETEVVPGKESISTTEASLDAETVTLTSSVSEKEKSTISSKESATEMETKIIDETKEVTTALPIKVKDAQTEITPEKESISTTAAVPEEKIVTMTSRTTEKEISTPITEESISELETKITDEMKEIATAFPTKEKDLATKVTSEKEIILTVTEMLEGETVTMTPSVTEKVNLTFTTEESKPELQTKISEMEVTTLVTEMTPKEKDIETKITPEVQFLSTTTAILEAETVTTTPRVTEKEKLAPTSDESKTELEMKITDEMKEITTIFSTKQKDVETEITADRDGTWTTAAVLETKTVTEIPTVTEAEISTSISRESTTESEMKKTDEMMEIITAISTTEKDVETKVTSEKESILTTQASLEVESVTLTSSVSEKEMFTPIVEESKSELDVKITDEMKEITTVFPITEKDVETEITPEKETILTTTEILGETVTVLPTVSEEVKLTTVTEKSETDLETKITEVKDITTMLPVKEKDMETEVTIKEKDLETEVTPEMKFTSTTIAISEAETVTITQSVTEKKKLTPTSEESKSEIEMKITDEIKEITTISPIKEKDVETEVTPVEEHISTTESSLEVQTVTLTSSVTEKEKSIITIKESKTELETKITDKMGEITTVMPTKEKETETEIPIEKDHILTTTAVLEAETVTMTSSVTEEEVSTPVIQESTTLEAQTTEKLMEITTAFPTKEKDLESEITPKKEMISTTTEIVEAQTATMTPNITEKEKLTPTTEEAKFAFETKITEVKEITTLPIKEKDLETDITSEKISDSATKEILETKTVTMPASMTEKEQFTTVSPETPIEGIMGTSEMENVSIVDKEFQAETISQSEPTVDFTTKLEPTTFVIKTTEKSEMSSTVSLIDEKEMKITEKESATISTSEIKTDSTPEKEPSMITDEELLTDSETKSTEETHSTQVATDITKDSVTDLQSKMTTTTILHTQRVSTLSSVGEKEMTTVLMERDETTLEAKTTDKIKEVTTAISLEEKDLETNVTTQKESLSTTAATLESETVTMKERITGVEEFTRPTEESKTDLAAEVTGKIKEISTTLPMEVKDRVTEITSKEQLISTTEAMLEAETVTLTPVTEREKVTLTTEESKTELKTKITAETEEITTILPIKEKDVEMDVLTDKEDISTTATLETRTVAVTPAATETEKSTSVLTGKTEEMTEIVTGLPTRETDVEPEVAHEKENISTTAVALDVETVTLTSSVLEKEKSTITTKESKTEIGTKITDEILSTTLPTKEEGIETEVTTTKDRISTTTATLEAMTITMKSSVTEKEMSTPVTEESKSELEMKTTDEKIEITTAFAAKEQEVESEIIPEKEIVSMTTEILEAETVTMTPSVTEKVKVTSAAEDSSSLPTDDSELKIKSFTKFDNISTLATTLVTEIVITEKEKITKTELGTDSIPHASATESAHTDKPLTESTYITEFTEAKSAEITSRPDTESVSSSAIPEFLESSSFEAESESTSQQFSDSDKISLHMTTEKDLSGVTEEVTLKSFSSVPTTSFVSFVENDTSVTTFIGTTEVKSETEMKETEKHTEKVTVVDISTLASSSVSTPISKDVESPITVKPDVSETMLDEITFKKTDVPLTTVHLEKISTIPPTLTDKIESIEILTSPIVPELISEKTDKIDNETTSTLLKFTTDSSTLPIEKVQSTTVSILKDLDRGLTSEETDQTIHETDIVTDNVFTSIKHVPDSLIREKTTIVTAKTEEITFSPIDVTQTTTSIADRDQFFDQDVVTMSTSRSSSEIDIEEKAQTMSLEGETSTGTLTAEKLKTTTLHDKDDTDLIKEEISTTSKAETDTSFKITDLDKGTELLKLSTPSLTVTPSSLPSAISTTVHAELEAETSSISLPKEEEIVSDVSIIDEENEILSRKSTVSETRDVDKFTAIELTKVTESEIVSKTTMTEPFVSTTEKVPELIAIQEAETSTLQPADKTLSTTELLTTEKFTTAPPVKETEFSFVTTATSKEPEVTVKIKLSAETDIPEAISTAKEPHITKFTSLDEIQTSANMTEAPTKEREITTSILSKLSTTTSSIIIEDKTTFSTALPIGDEKKDDFVTLSTSEIDITSTSHKTSFKFDSELSTDVGTTEISKDITKKPLTTETQREETVTVSSLEDKISTDKSETTEKDHITTLSSTEIPSIQTETSFLTSLKTDEIIDTMTSPTMLPKEITDKTSPIDMKSSTPEEEKEAETQQTEKFESTKALFTFTSKFVETSHMNDTTSISDKQTGTTESMTEVQTTAFESKQTEFAKGLSVTSTEVPQTTEKDSTTIKLQTHTALDFTAETVSEATSDITKESTMVSQVETKQTSAKDLPTSTSKMHATDMTTDKFDLSTETSIQFLKTTHTVTPIETFKAEEIETTSEHPPSTPEKIKTTLEITGFTSVDEKHIAVTQNTSTQIETSTKFFDSETKVEAELKTETTLFVSREEPSTLTSKDFTTAFPEKEQTTKLSTFDAETTFTEHSVITEETISSNATFAADAMIKSQTSTIDITTSSLKTDISVTEEGVSSVDLKPKTATDVTTFETEGKDIIETTTKKPATESSTEVEVDKEFTSEREFKSSTFSSIAAQDLELRTTVTDKSGIVTTTREFKDDTVFSEDKISPTDKSIKEITETKSETPMSSEKVTTDIITSDLTKVSLTTLKELEDKTESLFVTEFVGKTSEPIETQEAETATQQPEITATAFVEEDKTTLVDVTLIPMELTTEKAVSISKETDVSTTKLDISTLMEKSTDAPFIQTISTVNETTMEPFEISGRRDEKIDAITPEKETQLPTKIPDMIPTTSKDIKISLKLETDKTEFDDVSTAFMPTKIPTMTEETLLITDTEASEIYSSTTDEGTTILTFTKTQKPVDSATEITIKTETLQTAETTKPSDIITDKTTTLRGKTIFTETTKPTDVTEESLKPETTFKDDFVTKEIVSEIPKTFIEKEAEVPSEIDKSISEHSATSSAFSTTVSAPIVFETAETTETDITSSTVTEILHSETSTSLLTEKSPEVSESTSSTATTTLPKIVTEETTTLRSIMITDLGRKASISEAETETTPTVTKEDVTPETFEEVSLTETIEDECIVNGTAYRDGEAIITIDPCEKCHCSLGEINCFKILCKLPKENCIPKFSSTLECCPSSYECPEEDKEKASTQTSFAASEMDLTTPIPISFMFSTTPKAIASTIFVTKSEVEERKKDAATTLSTDHLPTTPKIEASTESGISVTTITTEKAVPDTVDLTGRKSTAEAKTEPPKDLFKHVGTTVKDFDLRATETTEIFSKETDLISTTEASKEVSEIDESTTLSMEGEESSETTPEKSVTSVTFKTSTVRKETDITEVTKQPTETPTTFDTIRTTFADVHKEKEDKVHALFESTTISPSTLGEEMTKLVDFTTVLSNISTAKPTEPETPSSPVSEHGLITTEKPLKGITTEKVEEGTKEVTTRFDETTTSKIFDVTEKEEPMFGETATAESSDESVTASAKISEVTSFTEDRETSTFTYMPSKLPKLDDMFTSTEMTVSETARSKEVTDDMVETAKAETMQTGVPTITEAVTKDVLKDSNVTTTVHDEVPTEIKTSTKSIVTEKESSVTFKPITEETSIKTDLEVDELSTTSESLKEISTIQHGETTDYEIVTKVFETRKTIDSLDQKGTVSLESETEFSTTSTFSPTSTEKSPDEISARTMKPKDIQLGLSSGLSTDKDGRPIVSVADEKPSPHTTETVTSLDKNETLFTHPKETEFPDVSTIFTPISNVTTEFREQSEETETSATVTDRIFTFVSTRFTDIMKGITEFTTAKEESKITDITQKESTTVSSFDMTTEKTEKVTPSTLLSHRIDLDLDQSTTKEEITQEAETVKSASEEPLTISEEKLTTHKFDIGITTDKLTVTPSDVSEVSSTVTPFSKSEVTTKFIAESAKEADSAVTEMIKEKIQTHRPDENVTSTEATSTDIVKESSVSSEFTTSSEEKDTVFFTEKKSADITSMTTILSKILPEEIVTRPSLFQNDTSSVQITEEITSESTKIEELTSFKTKEQTISSLSTEELAAETLKMEKETEVPSIIPHTKRTTIAFTTESEKEASFEETEVPSRATRKDVELEVTPPSFTKTDEDSEMRPGSTSTIDEKVTLRELSTSSESRLSVTSTSEHSTIHTETTVKSLEIGPTTHGIVTEKADSETLSIFNETVSISSEVTEEKITTTPLSQIVSETKTTDKEVSLTETKTEAFTPGIDIVTELPVIKTTLKEAIPSVAEDAETVKTETELPKVTESIDTVTHTTIEKSLATEEITTTQKAQLNLTEPISVATTLFPKLKTTVTASPMDTDGTTAKPMMTTVVEDAETTVVSFRKAPQTEATERPEISTFSTKEELNATEFVTKGYKAIETTTMKEEEDYIIDENTCIFEGRIFQSAEQIPRADPCEFCFCFRGDIICLQQSCPPPAPDCHQTTIPGYCCPRYECPVYVTSKNISALARRKGVTPIIIQRRIDKREISRPTMEVKGCQYNGTFYELGKTVTSASGPCLHCVCQEDGFMHCDPQRCKPEAPLMLKMNSNFFRRR